VKTREKPAVKEMTFPIRKIPGRGKPVNIGIKNEEIPHIPQGIEKLAENFP
jgi:hypothetical protein